MAAAGGSSDGNAVVGSGREGDTVGGSSGGGGNAVGGSSNGGKGGDKGLFEVRGRDEED